MARAVIVNNGLVENVVEIPDAGQPPVIAGLVLLPTGSDAQVGWTYDAATGTFTAPEPPLATAQASASSFLSASCAAAITSGFTSSALGTAHTYPSTEKDQINLLGSVADAQINAATANWTTPFWCADSTGAWDFHPHTAAQMIQAGQDGKAHVVACQTQLKTLLAKVQAATTATAALAITWTNPSA